jgi:hypothetical protein
MKKIVMSFILVCALAIAGSAQTTQKTASVTQPTTRSKTIMKTNSSSSTAQANKPKASTTTQKTTMMKPKHKHHTTHKAKQKTTK